MKLGRFGAAFAAILIATVLACTAVPAAAQTTTVTYISNMAQGGGDASASQFAQSFRTGSQTGGYRLTSVEFTRRGTRGQDMAVSVCAVDSDGEPTAECTALMLSDSPEPPVLVFTAPQDTVLEASKTYALRWVASEDFPLVCTSSDAEDAGGAAGWSIGNDSRFRYSSGANWIMHQHSISFSVKRTDLAPTAADNTITTLEDTAYAFGSATSTSPASTRTTRCRPTERWRLMGAQ